MEEVIIKIVSRWDSSRVLYEHKTTAERQASGLAMRDALEAAVRDGARLDGASLVGASLVGASLVGASLVGARLDGASLVGASLVGASLGDSLQPFKSDLFEILMRAPAEVQGVRDALVAGRVDGSTYEGECACLVGTISKVRHVNYQQLGNGIKPNSARAAEQWFMSIRKGHTPENSQIVAITVGWVDEFLGLLANVRATA